MQSGLVRAPIATEQASWPEILYRFVEHYKWEPGHLCIGDSLAVFNERIRRQEVPLNFLLALVLSWSPPDTILEIIRPFRLDDGSFVDDQLRFCYPIDAGYTQPDIQIASGTTRVFIELKWGAKVDLAQVQKYLLLHAALDIKSGFKRPYLLFLTKDEFKDCWKPRAETAMSPFIAADFLKEKTKAVDPVVNIPKRDRTTVFGRYKDVKVEVGYGCATWHDIYGTCQQIVVRLQERLRHAEAGMIQGFLSDLKRRLDDNPQKRGNAGIAEIASRNAKASDMTTW
jgi:hypothetical protein